MDNNYPLIKLNHVKRRSSNDDTLDRINNYVKLLWKEEWEERQNYENDERAERENSWMEVILQEFNEMIEHNQFQYLTRLLRIFRAFSFVGIELPRDIADWLWWELRDLGFNPVMYRLSSGLYMVLIDGNFPPSSSIALIEWTEERGWLEKI